MAPDAQKENKHAKLTVNTGLRIKNKNKNNNNHWLDLLGKREARLSIHPAPAC